MLTLILNKPGIGIGFLKLSPRITLIPHARGNQKSHGEAFSPNIGNENFVFLKAKISSCLVLLSLSRDLWPQESCDSSTSFGRTTSVSSSFPVYWDPVLLLICASGTTKKKNSTCILSFFFSFVDIKISTKKGTNHGLFTVCWKLPNYSKVLCGAVYSLLLYMHFIMKLSFNFNKLSLIQREIIFLDIVKIQNLSHMNTLFLWQYLYSQKERVSWLERVGVNRH